VILDSYAGQVAPIEYHYWNSTDPFYAFNTPDVLVRAGYYGASYVPSYRYDGYYILDLFQPYEAFYEFYRQTIDDLLAVPSPIRFNIDQHASAEWDSMFVSFDVIAEDSIDADDPVLYLAVVERYHRYAYPVGRWDYAFRDMVPDSDGEPITLQQGDSLHFDWAYPLDPIFNLDAVTTTLFVQKNADGGILQAACEMIPDISSVAGGAAPAPVLLGRNSPNPFSRETAITYSLGQAADVDLSVYSATGRLVRKLVDGPVEPGSHTATWDGRNGLGSEVSSGMYYYQLTAGASTRTGRMVLLR
jgi:hypothetical protein